MDGPGNLLSLKVMRLSRPAIAKAWEPFYSSSPSFSSHSTASVLSLQGNAPLPGHPKTLRDFTHATELLTLPSSFGSIQLGETFTGCLCVNNEANMDIDGVSMKVEMQTATSKVILSDFGGPDCRLKIGDTMENVVSHEIKELGQHVLACTVAYRLPQDLRGTVGAEEVSAVPESHSFRKFYKFAVTNPLSVKTKVHAARSPSALFSATEKHKIFLEVHIQNLAQECMWFERMQFQCVEGWKVEDGNLLDARENEEAESVFSGSISLMQPQDTRQYIYILQPTSPPTSPTTHEPGSIIPLGRLDLSWRSAFGEPGRLLTSMLSRRIPLPPPPLHQPASALPSYLKRTPTPSTVPSRPHSPHSTNIRSGTPPPAHRPGSPFRSRTPIGTARSHSPAIPAPLPWAAATQSLASALIEASDVQVDLVVHNIPRETITIEKPFTISFTLLISAFAPPSRTPAGLWQHRLLSLAVQHAHTPEIPTPSPKLALIPDALSPRLPQPGVSAPDVLRDDFNHRLTHPKVLVASPKQDIEDGDAGSDTPLLPTPFAAPAPDTSPASSRGIVFLGSSAVFLDPIRLSQQDHVGTEADGSPPSTAKESNETRTPSKTQMAREFSLSYLPLRNGFSTVGGLRVLLIEDRIVTEDAVEATEKSQGARRQAEARILEEWGVIGEVWVRS